MIELEGRSRWLLMSQLLGSSIAALPCAAYLAIGLQLGDLDRPRLALFVVVIGAASLILWALVAQAQVRNVRHLATGRLAASEENLIAAIRELRRLPDWLGGSSLGQWLVGAVAMISAMKVAFDAPIATLVRVGAVAITCGLLSSVLVRLIALRRARKMIELVARRVPAPRVLDALKSQRRQQATAQLVMLTAVVVVLPTCLVADAGRVQTYDVLEAVAKAPQGDQVAVASAAARTAVGRVLLLVVLLGLAALAAASMAGRNLAEPMRHVAEEANRISRGDLREVHIVAAEDDVWEVTSTFTRTQAQLQDVITQLQRAGISIGTTTEQLMATSSKYESGAADQATSLNETSATTEELAQSARQISHNAGAVSELAQKTLDAARAGQDSAKAFVSAVERMKSDNHSIAEAVTRLQKRVQQIGRIVEFITTVADRSDLLALSAELEGTKAGEVGRGFTLVAAEMRRLAENVIESTNEIEELIGEIREATAETVGATGRGMEHTESGTALAGAVSSSLQSVVGLAQSTSDSVRAISLATQQQQTSTDQLAEAMADILGITQQSLAATKQVTSANHELISLSADLKGLVDQFQVGKR
ncbi:MAG: methyl-accepting chemotaxis protein [Myxococcaceae bacterium]|nr:methyl-accepting chemotaxis protein [Myxococcaceae bacterium]